MQLMQKEFQLLHCLSLYMSTNSLGGSVYESPACMPALNPRKYAALFNNFTVSIGKTYLTLECAACQMGPPAGMSLAGNLTDNESGML